MKDYKRIGFINSSIDFYTTYGLLTVLLHAKIKFTPISILHDTDDNYLWRYDEN